MEKEEQLFRKRIQELAENAYSRDIPLHTDFLTLAEQTVFQNMSATLPPVKFVLSGGFPMSERFCAFWRPMRRNFTRRPSCV